jgi:adenine phosphoribosyltransferase
VKYILTFISLFSFSLLSSAEDHGWISNYLELHRDFPQPGIIFQWYGPLLRDPEAFNRVIEAFAAEYKDQNIQAIVGIDSRGFIFGTALASKLQLPLVLARKPGKLPGKVISTSYQMEYGTNSIEIEVDAIQPNSRVLIMDDLVATGGTALAVAELIEKAGGEVAGLCCLIDIPSLNPKSKFNYPIFSLFSVQDYE